MLEAEEFKQSDETHGARAGGERRPHVVVPMSGVERRSISYADADGWRCFYPLTRGHLSAAEARAVLRRERGMPEETAEEAAAAEFVLVVGPERF
ncbi:hypothetical protein ABIE21_001270 [Conyzicola nivalis]|uniref:Uncharacterized protein n=2 Tax=Conyzicola nivalis TaxID=1477021 RepID=A0ABV2QL54_9MICO